MLKLFVIYIVINIIGNFLIKAFSLMVLRNFVTEIVLPTYQLPQSDLFNKNYIDQWKGKISPAVKCKIIS